MVTCRWNAHLAPRAYNLFSARLADNDHHRTPRARERLRLFLLSTPHRPQPRRDQPPRPMSSAHVGSLTISSFPALPLILDISSSRVRRLIEGFLLICVSFPAPDEHAHLRGHTSISSLCKCIKSCDQTTLIHTRIRELVKAFLLEFKCQSNLHLWRAHGLHCIMRKDLMLCWTREVHINAIEGWSAVVFLVAEPTNTGENLKEMVTHWIAAASCASEGSTSLRKVP